MTPTSMAAMTTKKPCKATSASRKCLLVNGHFGTHQYAGAPVHEAHVQQTITEFMKLDGWRAIRTDPVSDRSRGKGFGEVGMPDHLYVRYHGSASNCPDPAHASQSPLAEVLWIEFKAPGKAAKAHQIEWHAAERKRGALVLVVDDIDGFIAWYKASGLARRV